MPTSIPILPNDLQLQLKGERSPAKKIEIWLLACRNIQYVDPAQALEFARQAERVAKSAKIKEREIHSYRMGGICMYAMYDYAGALKVFEKCIVQYRRIRHIAGLSKSYQNRGLALHGLGRNEEALVSYREAEAMHREQSDDVALLSILNNIGSVAGALDRPADALAAYSDALALAERMNDDFSRAMIIGNIADVYILLGDNEVGLDWARRSLELHRANKEFRGAGLTLLNIGRIYQSTGEWNTAATYFEEALSTLKPLNEVEYTARAYQLISGLNLAIHDWNKATEFATKAIELFAITKDVYRQLHCIITLCEALPALKRLAEAHEWLQQARTLVHQTDNVAIRLEVELISANLAVSEQDWTTATAYLEVAAEFAKTHNLIHRQALIADTQAEVYDKTGNYAAAIACARRAYILQKRSEEHTRNRHSYTLQLRMDVERADRERAMVILHNEKLSVELESRNRELNVHAVSVAQKNELLNGILNDVKSVAAASEKERPALIKDLIRRIDMHRRTGDDWKSLGEQLKDVHPAFQKSLLELCPTLTPAEVRIASLLKMKMSTKGISDVLQITGPAIDVYRSRIRKKLNVAGSISLVSFLENVG